MRIFFSAGEPSGDLHAANLVRELRKRGPLAAYGLGSKRMQAEGCQLVRDMSELAVMGFFPVVAKLPEFFRLLAEVKRELDRLDGTEALIEGFGAPSGRPVRTL